MSKSTGFRPIRTEIGHALVPSACDGAVEGEVVRSHAEIESGDQQVTVIDEMRWTGVSIGAGHPLAPGSVQAELRDELLSGEVDRVIAAGQEDSFRRRIVDVDDDLPEADFGAFIRHPGA